MARRQASSVITNRPQVYREPPPAGPDPAERLAAFYAAYGLDEDTETPEPDASPRYYLVKRQRRDTLQELPE